MLVKEAGKRKADARWHLFKVRLSGEDWYDLLTIAECEDRPVSEALRGLIAKRAAEIRVREWRNLDGHGWRYMITALGALSRRTAALSRVAAREAARTDARGVRTGRSTVRALRS